MTLGILLPAAGASVRMLGRDKLLEKVDGTALLQRQFKLCNALQTPLLVTLRDRDDARRATLANLLTPNTTILALKDASTGFSASLRASAEWAQAQGLQALMVVLPDLPDLTTDDLTKIASLQQQFPGEVIRATDVDGQLGHPTILPARLFPALLNLQGDHGARHLLKSETIRTCPLPAHHATTDLDTPEAWAAWRAARQT